MTFTSQPYPVYAVALVVEQDPARFALVDPEDPIRLVLGWQADDDNTIRPVLLESPVQMWRGPVLYAEDRDRAAVLVKEIRKFEKHEIRMDAVYKIFPSLRP